MDMGENLVFCRLYFGEAHLLAGHLEEAHVLAERARAFAHAHQERGHEAYALRLIGDIATSAAPGERAGRRPLPRGPDLAEELGMRPLVAHLLRVSVHCMPTSASESRPTPNYRLPSQSTALWR